MNENLKLSNEQIRQFAYDWYDVIIQDIKECREKEKMQRKGAMLQNKTVKVHK